MQALILPGLDGTGLGLAPFIAALRPRLEARALVYPADPALDYAGLAEWVRPHLPDGAFVLIGESFSGPIAVRLAAQRPAGLAGLVLCASFVRAPRSPGSPWDASAWARLAGALPLSWLPMRVLAAATFGPGASPEQRAQLRDALAALPPAVLRARLRAVGQAQASHAAARLRCPILYLRARRDRLVSAASADWLQRLQPSARVSTLEAPHFLLQTQAEAAAAALLDWLDAARPAAGPELD